MEDYESLARQTTELAPRHTATLAAKFKEEKDAKALTGKVPAEKQIGEWIETAKALPKKVVGQD